MGVEEKKPDAGTGSSGPDKKIVYAVIAVAVVILAVMLVAKFGFNTDLLNPSGGQMSVVQRNISYKVATPTFTKVPTYRLELCPQGTTGCSGTCVNTSFDLTNCGSCGNTCRQETGAFCSLGTCCYPHGDVTCEGVVCESGYSCCRGRCVPGGV